ncbi:EAL domain-containing protein (plasmid) [Deinococcus taeanensis]|uniref:putative bifunctional diguanylate cyclase/phosphodiesterase n=1 Tax=Deinococcus taeanensis TaxID=2737050 RepID=UPI001CDC032F|nr:EAL domain-containing protein [Deinococcus taeanensis]UBV44982.1 EAL domain-containing protein [Deinococcus taeanensis]
MTRRRLACWLMGSQPSLRAQLLAALATLLLPLGAVLLIALPTYMNRRFDAIERSQVTQFTNIARFNLNAEQERVSLFVLNFSLWTETFEYAAGRNPRYLSANLVPGTFIGGKVDYWGVAAPSGQVISAATLRGGRIISAGPTVRAFLAALPRPMPSGGATGLVRLGQEAYILAGRPITRDDGSGRGGVMLLARRVTPGVLSDIIYDDDLFSVALRPAATASTEVRLLDRTAMAVSPLNAPAGPPQLAVELRIPRAVHAAGLESTHQLRAVMVLTSLAAVLSLTLFLNRRVLSVLEGYKRDTQRIALDPAHRLDARDSTELGVLGRTINHLLDHLHEREAQLLERSRRDELTGAYTRSGLLERLDHHSVVRGALLIEVPRLQELSGLYGSDAVDTLLRELARRLHAVGDGHLVARLSTSSLALITLTDPLAPRTLLRTLERPLAFRDGEVSLTLSAGYAAAPHGVSITALLRQANIALQHALDQEEPLGVFNDAMLERSHYGHQLQTQLQGAQDRGELSLLYQPICDLQTGEWTALEALLRWQHPQLGPVPPTTFIPIAERSGVIHALGDWVIRTALRETYAAGAVPGGRINVNVSPLQLLAPDFAQQVLNLLREEGAAPQRLTVEVTESTVMQNVDLARAHLHALRAAGVHVALDDFGSGHSSLSLLADLPLDTVKLDRTFLRDAVSGGPRLALLSNSIHLARDLNLRTVVEGVEDEAMLNLLRHLGCDAVQGYHILRPSPLSELRRSPPR